MVSVCYSGVIRRSFVKRADFAESSNHGKDIHGTLSGHCRDIVLSLRIKLKLFFSPTINGGLRTYTCNQIQFYGSSGPTAASLETHHRAAKK